jgi:twitching motility protein PilT
VCDVEALGRVRCLTFSDQRGPGAIFRFVPPAQSAEQLGLSREIQELASASDGLILVAGSRSSGKRTLMSALVDLVNRDRCDHVISIEREVGILHANIKSFISQREVPGDEDALLVAARAALREDPDVLVLDEIRARRSMDIAFDAAAAGRLVIAGVSARHTAHAIERIVDFYPVEAASQMRLALAERLRGVVAQVLLPRTGGGRVAAREVLLNTSAVAGAIAEGKTSSLSSAIEGGRRHGMVSLQDALMALVQSQMVDARDACRHISDVPAFLDALERHGIDTSAVERTA